MTSLWTRAVQEPSRIALILSIATAASCSFVEPRTREPELRWWKGNTHAHTYWSDGTSAPQVAVRWYREHGYHFLVLSEHDRFPVGERWYRVSTTEDGALSPQKLADLRAEYGDAAIETREQGGAREMRLWTIDELRHRYEVPGAFLLVPGEEITASFGAVPVHVNGINLVEPIEPAAAPTLAETIRANLAAVDEQAQRFERPMVAQLNHPNFKWALTANDVAASPARFVEVFNGHPGTHSAGDASHLSAEEIWDSALAARCEDPGAPLIYGIASDDAHDYPDGGAGPTPGRGWIVVRAMHLDGDELARAMQRGDFYASSGVTLTDVACDGITYRVAIDAEPGVEYTTRFFGKRAGRGAVIEETQENPAIYCFRGDELYVRATVTSTRRHPRPPVPWDFEKAWTQPVRPRAREQR